MIKFDECYFKELEQKFENKTITEKEFEQIEETPYTTVESCGMSGKDENLMRHICYEVDENNCKTGNQFSFYTERGDKFSFYII